LFAKNRCPISQPIPHSPVPHGCLVPSRATTVGRTGQRLPYLDLGNTRDNYISRWLECLNSEGNRGFSPLFHLHLPHGFRCSSQARNRKTLRQVHSTRIAENWLDGPGLGAIDKHKSETSHKPPSRTNVYVNPSYKPPSRSNQVPPRPAPYHRPAPIKNTGEKRDVVLNGVAFQSSARSLVRKDRECPLGKCGNLEFSESSP
jgi:hypothetical protein